MGSAVKTWNDADETVAIVANGIRDAAVLLLENG
jgi:hypothetical protein